MERIAVYGAGTIGSCQATLIIGNGLPCTVIGHSERGLERCRKSIEQNWDDLIAEGLATEGNKQAAMALVTITNDRWINAEIQQYVEQIEAAVLQREEKIVLQPGNYPEYPDKPWYYASRARSIVAANGYAVGGLISGEDFVLGSGKINSSTKEFVINVEYPAAGSSLEADGQPSPQQDAGKVGSME